MGSQERLELVIDFASLRAGALVVGKPCTCGGAHRGVLVRLVPYAYGDAWEMLPKPPCCRTRTYGPSPRDIVNRAVWRVVDDFKDDIGDETSEPTSRTSRRPAKLGAR